MGDPEVFIIVVFVSFLFITNEMERRRNAQLIKDLTLLQKASTVNDFAKYEEKDVEIPDEEDDNDFSSYVSISEATPDELRNATINLTPYQK